MSVVSIQRNFNDQPQIVNMAVTDSQATIAATGWLALPATIASIELANSGVWVWQPGDLVLVYSQADKTDVLYQVNSSTNSLILYSTAGAGGVTLPVVNNDFVNFSGTLGQLADSGYSPSDASKTKVVMAGSATQVNYIAHFVDTAGTVDDTPANIQNDGNIQAGKSGVAGTLISFPGTAANGSLILAAANAGGAFNMTVSNGALAQSSVLTIPDVGAVTGFIVSNPLQGKMKSVTAAVVAGGNASQTVTDAFCTTTSTVVANWNTSANPVSIEKVTPGNGSFVVLSSGDPGASTLGYIIMK